MDYIRANLIDKATELSEEFKQLYKDHGETINKYFEHLLQTCVPVHDFNDSILSLLSMYSSNDKSIGLIPAGKITRDILPLCSEQGIANIQIYDNDAERIGYIEDYAVRKPEEMAFALDEKIVITSLPFYDEIYSQLLQMGVAEEKIISYKKIAELCPVDKIRCEDINYTFRDKNKKRIVFLNISFPWANIDRIRLLRQRYPNYSLILLTNQDFMFNGPGFKGNSDSDDYFDHKICMNLPSLMYMAKLLSEDDILMTSGFPFCNLAVLLINTLTRAKHIHEIYDLCDELVHVKKYPHYHHHKFVVKDVGENIWEADNAAKKILFSKLDKILYRDDPIEFSFLQKYYAVSTPSFHMLPFHVNRNLPDVEKKKGIHIAHCGHIVFPLDDDIWTDCGVQDSLQVIVPEVANQKIHFHLFNPSDPSGLMASRFLEGNHTNNEPYIHYHKPEYDDKLIQILSGYTFGWMVYDFSRYTTTHMSSHHHTLSTKLFTYIQAGLPVIISEEYKYMVDICNKYSIGIVLSRKDVPQLGEILKDVDVSSLLKNVHCARYELDISKIFRQYVDFIVL